MLIVITPPSLTNLRTEAAIANKLLSGNASAVLHLRKPGADILKVQQYLALLAAPHQAKVVLHSHYSMASDYPVKGIHFPEHARPPPALLERRPGQTLSTSFHDLDTLDGSDWSAFDYAFLSPIFNSISKEGYKAAQFDTERLQATLARASRPRLVALGGITAARVEQCQSMGFAGVAVIGAVWDAADPAAACMELQRACAGQWGIAC